MMSKFFYMVLLMAILPGQPKWHTSIEEAKQLAASQHKLILLNFSGSDWCAPCIVLRKDVLNDSGFLSMADSTLVLVNADFPRLKKNQLPKQIQQANDVLADQYNPQGKFPLTLLLDPNGKVIKEWEGNPGLKASEFTQDVLGAAKKVKPLK